MIDGIKLLSLRNGECIQFLRHLLETILHHDPDALQVRPYYDTLLATSLEIQGLYMLPAQNPNKGILKKLDLRRDHAFNGIAAMVHAFLYSVDKPTHAHATELARYLARLKAGFTRTNRVNQSYRIKILVEEWQSKPKLVAAVAALRLESWIQELAISNNNYNEQELTEAMQWNVSSKGAMKLKRAEAAKQYKKLRQQLQALHIIHNGAQPFDSTIRVINELIAQYNLLITRRAAHANRAEKKRSIPDTSS